MADNDILIGGFTVFDSDGEALDGILGEWADDTAGTAGQRRQSLLTGIQVGGRTVALDMTSVRDDGAFDVLTGASGGDWYFLFDGDQANGLTDSDFTNDLDQGS